MPRSHICRVWNSRTRLSLLSSILALISVHLNTYHTVLNDSGDIANEAEGSSFYEDMDYVLESIQYMRDLKAGKAEIRPVIEKVVNYSVV